MKCKRCKAVLVRSDHYTKGTNSDGYIEKPTVCMKCKSKIGAKARLAQETQLHVNKLETVLNNLLSGGLVLKKDEEDEEVE